MTTTLRNERVRDGLATAPRVITKEVMGMAVSTEDCLTYQGHNHGPYDVSRCRLADRLRITGKKQGKRFSMLHRGPSGNAGALMIWRIE